MSNKQQYCNDCMFSDWMAGIGRSITDKLGQAPHPYPTHTCKRLNVTRERKHYSMRRLPDCISQGYAEYKKEE